MEQTLTDSLSWADLSSLSVQSGDFWGKSGHSPTWLRARLLGGLLLLELGHYAKHAAATVPLAVTQWVVLVHKHSQPIAFHLATQLSRYLETCHTKDVQATCALGSWLWGAGVQNVANGNAHNVCVHVFIRVWVFAEAAYLLIIGLQYVIEPGDLSQFAQFHLHTLQSTGQLLLFWWVQLLQEGTHKPRSTTHSILEGELQTVKELKSTNTVM